MKRFGFGLLQKNLIDTGSLSYHHVNSAVGKVANNSPELMDKSEIFEV